MKSRSVLSCVAITLLLVCSARAQAQEKNPKYEFGLHYSALNVSEKSDTDSGIGVRFTYNFNDFLAAPGLEPDRNLYPDRSLGRFDPIG